MNKNIFQRAAVIVSLTAVASVTNIASANSQLTGGKIADKRMVGSLVTDKGSKIFEIARKGGASVPGEKRSFAKDRDLAARLRADVEGADEEAMGLLIGRRGETLRSAL